MNPLTISWSRLMNRMLTLTWLIALAFIIVPRVSSQTGLDLMPSERTSLQFAIQKYKIPPTAVVRSTAELVVQKGHTGLIHDIKITPDGKYLVSASADGTINVWDIATAQVIHTLFGLNSETIYESAGWGQVKEVKRVGFTNASFVAVDISSDGKYIAGGTNTSSIFVWDVMGAKPAAAFVGERSLTGFTNKIRDLAFDPSGKYIVAVGHDRRVKIWDFKNSPEPISLKGHDHAIDVVVVTPDGKLAITGGGFEEDVVVQPLLGPKIPEPKNKHELKQWSLATTTFKKDMIGHKDVITDLAISGDGKNLAAVLLSGEVQVFNMMVGLPMVNYAPIKDGKSFKAVHCVSIHPDGSTMAVGVRGKKINMVSVKNGKELSAIATHKDVRKLTYSPDGSIIASSYSYVDAFSDDFDTAIDLWNTSSGQKIRTLKGLSAIPHAVAVESTGRYAAVAYSDGTVKIWNIVLAVIEKSFSGSGSLVSVDLSRDGKTVAAGNDVNAFFVWDVRTGRLLLSETLEGRSDSELRAIALSRNGKYLATSLTLGSSFSKGRQKAFLSGTADISVWDISSGRKVLSLPGHDKMTWSAEFSPDDKTLLTCGKEIKIWDLQTGKLQKTLDTRSEWIHDLAVSPNGKQVASVGRSGFYMSNIETGKAMYAAMHTSRQDITVAYQPYGFEVAVANGGSSRSYSIDIYAAGYEQKRISLTGHNGAITSVQYTADAQRLISASLDGTVKIWDVKGAVLATLVSVGEKGYVVSAPDNYYLASKDAYKGVSFRSNNKLFPFEQFDLAFNRPDIVLKRIGYVDEDVAASYHRAYQKRLAKMGFTEDMLSTDFHLPEVSISNASLPLTTKAKQLTLNFSASDSKYRLDRINVYVNDVPLHGTKGMDLRSSALSSYKGQVTLELSNGKNKIQISTLNQKAVESLKETVEIIYDGPPTRPNLYVVAIGVSNYADDDFDLTYAAKDAKDLSTLLESASHTYADVKVKTILDKRATKSEILKMKTFLMDSQVDDEVILFVAGHGLLDDNLDYYLATHDVDFDNPSLRGLPYSDLENLVDGIPARKKLILIDACHSGEVDKEETILVADNTTSSGSVKSRAFKLKKAQRKSSIGLRNSFELMKELFSDLRRGSGAVVISSASGVEYAFESSEWKNGVFTYALLEGLKSKSADKNKDGSIVVSELREYVTDKVKQLTDGKQTPTARQENLEFDFRVY